MKSWCCREFAQAKYSPQSFPVKDGERFQHTKEDKPLWRIRQVYVLNRWIFTEGLRRHLYENAGPNNPKILYRAFLILKSTFFCSCSTPLTICPRCSLSNLTFTFTPSNIHGETLLYTVFFIRTIL